MCVGPTAATQVPTSSGLSFPSGSTLETQRLQSESGPAQQREVGGGDSLEISPQRRRPRPLPSTQKARRLLILLKLGWAGGHPRAWVPLPRRNSETPPEILALLGQGGRGGRWLRDSGGLGGVSKWLRGGQRPVRAWQAAPPLRALGETTASGGGCGMRDAREAANGGAGRRAGAMATANGGPGRGPAAAAGLLASSRVQGLRVRAWWWGR